MHIVHFIFLVITFVHFYCIIQKYRYSQMGNFKSQSCREALLSCRDVHVPVKMEMGVQEEKKGALSWAPLAVLAPHSLPWPHSLSAVLPAVTVPGWQMLHLETTWPVVRQQRLQGLSGLSVNSVLLLRSCKTWAMCQILWYLSFCICKMRIISISQCGL